MVNNILQIAQLKKGQVKMNIELLDMHELVHKVADSIALQISSAKGTKGVPALYFCGVFKRDDEGLAIPSRTRA